MRLLPTERARVNILGVGVDAVDMRSAALAIDAAVSGGRKGYVCVTGVHGIMEAQRDERLKAILNHSLLTTPDGMPTVWLGRWYGFDRMHRVYGPDLMLEVCALSARKGYTHFLYGGKPGVAEQLRSVLQFRFPGIKILGAYCPPFRPLDQAEQRRLVNVVASLRPDLFWVGLSTPKQERFMAQFLGELNIKVMLGVGAAFDIHAGLVQDSPRWVKAAGLQWLHRLYQEPGRLWKRYLRNNPEFMLKVSLQLAGLRSYPIPAGGERQQPLSRIA